MSLSQRDLVCNEGSHRDAGNEAYATALKSHSLPLPIEIIVANWSQCLGSEVHTIKPDCRPGREPWSQVSRVDGSNRASTSTGSGIRP
jgi:hypothetical protein